MAKHDSIVVPNLGGLLIGYHWPVADRHSPDDLPVGVSVRLLNTPHDVLLIVDLLAEQSNYGAYTSTQTLRFPC